MLYPLSYGGITPIYESGAKTLPIPKLNVALGERFGARVAKGRGQATTEVVLLLPLFMFFLFAFAKLFAVLVLVQKMEIASYYAARRWQLESHRNVAFEGGDANQLCSDIEQKVACYLGFVRNECPANESIQSFLSLDSMHLCPPVRTQVWNIVTLKVWMTPINTPFLKKALPPFEVVKYVPNRDRPIAFVLPGLKDN